MEERKGGNYSLLQEMGQSVTTVYGVLPLSYVEYSVLAKVTH